MISKTSLFIFMAVRSKDLGEWKTRRRNQTRGVEGQSFLLVEVFQAYFEVISQKCLKRDCRGSEQDDDGDD